MSAAFETARDAAARGLPVFPTHSIAVDGMDLYMWQARLRIAG